VHGDADAAYVRGREVVRAVTTWPLLSWVDASV
jgi:hypothetical protein